MSEREHRVTGGRRMGGRAGKSFRKVPAIFSEPRIILARIARVGGRFAKIEFEFELDLLLQEAHFA
jgi:hypothetical protein